MVTGQSRSNYERDMESMLHGVTTPLYIDHSSKANGTGFFYYVPATTKSVSSGKRPIYEDIWLVTNRHVIFGNDNELEPTCINFKTRRIENQNIVRWNNYAIDMNYLSRELRLPENGTIDIAIIRVTDQIKIHHPPQDLMEDTGFFAVSESLIPGGAESTGQKVQSGDDVLIVGYPRGLLIQDNLYPIIKSSCIASKWGSNFDGKPCFITDRRLMPGSSGSLVITKPTNFIILNGKVISHTVKQFMFLGVYSEEPTPLYVGTDTGLVWYSSLIKNTILHGIKMEEK